LSIDEVNLDQEKSDFEPDSKDKELPPIPSNTPFEFTSSSRRTLTSVIATLLFGSISATIFKLVPVIRSTGTRVRSLRLAEKMNY
jgi:hypothetical protein